MSQNNKKDTRTIRTGLFTKIACEIMDSVMGQLSDGWGENNTHWDKYWKYCRIEQEPNGEVIIKVSNEVGEWVDFGRHYVSNALRDMSDDEVKVWLARLLKKTAKMEEKDLELQNVWKRDCNEKCNYLDGTFAQCYFVYETLLGRSRLNKYSSKLFESTQGRKANAETVKKEVKRRESVSFINAKFSALREQAIAAKKKAIKDAEDAYDAKIRELFDEQKKELAEFQEA